MLSAGVLMKFRTITKADLDLWILARFGSITVLRTVYLPSGFTRVSEPEVDYSICVYAKMIY